MNAVVRQPDAKRGRRALLIAALLALLVVPRVIALDADTWPALCWNSGIWTDEGFYTYNARNAVLFGKPELDEFNNRNLSPVLDAVQRAVFQAFGVGLVQARALSVLCGLLALGLFFDAMRRAFGWRVGITALLLLGGEVSFILYNRLALMETPSVLVLCAALWAFVLNRPVGWALAGALAVGAVAFKTSFLIFLPLPLLAWLWRRAEGGEGVGRPVRWYVGGAALGAALYLLLWGLPRGEEIWRMNNYYRTRQVQPRSLTQALDLGHRSLLLPGPGGLLHRLETRTPVLTTLALVGLLAVPLAGCGRRARTAGGLRTDHGERRRDTLRVLWLWAALGLAFLVFSRYAPTRYYLIVYPALAGLASVTLWRLRPLWRWARRRRTGVALALVGLPVFFLIYHLLLLGGRAIGATGFDALGLVLGGLLAGVLTYALLARLPRLPHPRTLAAGALALFSAVSLGQWSHWYVTRDYRTQEVARTLEGIVGRDRVLAGDWAPNLCLENAVRAVPVLPGLANWRDPVRRVGADYVLVTQTPYPVRYWRRQAPDVVRPENLVRRIQIHDYRLHLYRVPAEPSADAVARAASAGPHPRGALR